MKNIVVLISANAEWRAIKEIFSGQPLQFVSTPVGETFTHQLSGLNLVFLHGGWGKISASATAQYAIDHFAPDLLANLGTCGGLDGRAAAGDILLVERTLVYDIIEQMGDPQAALEHYSTQLDLSWLGRAALPEDVRRGLLVSADRDILSEDVAMLIERFGASAADWESGAIAWVASRNAVRCLILRGVTDVVSPTGGEAYGNIELFYQRTLQVMRRLLDIFPQFLEIV